MARTAAVYVRISEDREGAGLGVQRQEQDCRALAGRLGWDVRDVYVDNDLSAYNGARRPAYERLLDDVRDGTVDGLVAWHTDRLHRSPKELETFIDLLESRDVAVQTVKAGTLDLATPSGRAVSRTLGAWARFESEHKSDRSRRKARELAEAGKVAGGGTRPFGFEDDRVTVRAEEAVLIREAADRVLAGDSIRGIASDWQHRRITTPTGKPWQPSPLKRMLASGRIAGWREHRGELAAPATWPGIIDRDEHDRLRRILRDPRRRTALTNARSYLLSGMLRCGPCGCPLRARPRTDHVRRYVCASGPMYGGCGKVAIVAGPLEEYVSEMVLAALDTPEMQDAIARQEADATTEDAIPGLQRDEDALDELARDYYADHIIGRSEYLAARSELEARIEAGRRRLARRRPIALVGSGIRGRWPALTFDQRRAVLSDVLEQIRIGSGRRGYNRFDPERVKPSWRY